MQEDNKDSNNSAERKSFRTQPVKAKHDKYDRFAGENPYDPIQRVIDHQLAIPWCGEWYDRTKKSDECYISTTISRGSSAMDKKNDIENRLLGAIEWKQKRDVRNWKIYSMWLNGYTQQEVGDAFELSDRQIRRIVKKITNNVLK